MAAPQGPRRPLGQILQDKKLITQEQLEEALNVQKNTSGAKIGRVLVDLGYVSQQDIDRAYAEQLGYPYLELDKTSVDEEVSKTLPQSVARRYKAIPIRRNGNRLVVALADPTNVFALDDIRLITGFEVEPMLASEGDLDTLIRNSDGHGNNSAGGGGGGGADMQSALNQIMSGSLPATDVSGGEDEDSMSVDPNEAPIIRVMNVLLSQAIRDGASDIHIEPERKAVRIRYRIYGVLHEIMSLPKYLHAALLSRLKIMSELNIAERRLPQDGHIRVRHEGRDFDIRVSTIPTVFGEKAVMRLLEQTSVLLGLERLGLFPEEQAQMETLIVQPHGIILSTGPTGHGKTTTQCSILSKLVSPEINIMTVEDPVEYIISGVNQVHVNRKAGLTFATALRSFLRQDPDIIMVGEIRDLETAETAIQASLTGHLVLSTLHTNDAPSSITRLVDMGVEPFLVSASLTGVLAQRLARKICPSCKEPYKPPAEALARLGFDSEKHKDVTFYRGKGCDACRYTGYSKRIGIFELMTINSEIRDLIVKRAPLSEVRAAARAAGMKSLKEDGLAKVLEGITTIEEVMRVVFTAGD
jgi:type IV pilus assembly protein PilB